MIAHITIANSVYTIDLSQPLDISIPLRGDVSNVNAWYVDHPKIVPHVSGDFVGKVSLGASVNFNDVWFNPHAHGTHTECVGHITTEFRSINQHLKQYMHLAQVISVAPGSMGKDMVISKQQLQNALQHRPCTAVVLRTLPNTHEKLGKQYSNTNPPYLLEEAAIYLAHLGIAHLLIDLPSVDKEHDEGKLVAHRAFWNMDGEIRYHATITELVYVPNTVPDGTYILDLQVAPFENDASPSRPVLYKTML